MTNKREFRQFHIDEYRVSDNGKGEIVADVLTYDVLDDYGTEFAPGVFDESMSKRMPRICWGHDWKDPIGQWHSHKRNGKKERLEGQLDLEMIEGTDRPAVPTAHRAYVQLEKRTIDQFSVGFVRQIDEKGKVPGTFRIIKGILDEVSPVLVGAVPGTKLISVRSRLNAPRLTRSGVPAGTSLWVPADVTQDIIVRFERGDLDLGDAIAELKGAALTYDELPTAPPEEEETEDPPNEETPETPPAEEEDGWSPEDLDAQLAGLGLEVDA